MEEALETLLDFEDNLEQLLEQWVIEFGDDITRTAYALVNDRHLAQDIAQEVFMRAYKGYKSFRKESDVKTWLIRITINAAKDMRRTNWFKRVSAKEKITETAENLDALGADAGNAEDSPEASVIKSAERKIILDALRKIPYKYAQTLVLHYFNGLSTQEIAEACKCSQGTVTSRLKRGRDLLRTRLGKGLELEKRDEEEPEKNDGEHEEKQE